LPPQANKGSQVDISDKYINGRLVKIAVITVVVGGCHYVGYVFHTSTHHTTRKTAIVELLPEAHQKGGAPWVYTRGACRVVHHAYIITRGDS
jgi:hypothetical protein